MEEIYRKPSPEEIEAMEAFGIAFKLANPNCSTGELIRAIKREFEIIVVSENTTRS